MTTPEHVQTRVLKRELPNVAWYVYQALRLRADRKQRTCNPPIRLIALDIENEFGVSYTPRHISRGLKILRDAGIIRIRKCVRPGIRGRGRGQTSNLYQVIDRPGLGVPQLPPAVAARGRVRVCPSPHDINDIPPVGTLEAKQKTASSPTPSPQAETGFELEAGADAPDNGTGPPSERPEIAALASFFSAANGKIHNGAENVDAVFSDDDLAGLAFLLDAHGFARSKAIIRIFRTTAPWSGWPASMLANTKTLMDVMDRREFPAVYQRYRNDDAAAAAAAVRSASAGELFARLLPGAGADPSGRARGPDPN